MIVGSSAFSHENIRQKSNPAIRVTLRDNRSLFDKQYVNTQSYGIKKLDSTLFNSKWVEAGWFSSGSKMRILSRSTEDYSVIAGSCTSFTIPLSLIEDGMQLYSSGSTLNLYYIDTNFAIRRLTSSDGVTWGSSLWIHTGNSDIASFTICGDSKIYFLQYIEKNWVLDDNRLELKSLIHNGTTWIERTITSEYMMSETVQVQDQTLMNVFTDDDYDEVIVACRGVSAYTYINQTGVSDRVVSRGLRVIRTDGEHYLGSFDLFDTSDNSFTVSMPKVHNTSGDSISVLPLRYIKLLKFEVDEEKLKNFWVLSYAGEIFNPYFTRNNNDKTWSNLQFTGLSISLNVSSTYRGNTTSIFNTLFTRDMTSRISSTKESLDVSKDIITYSNSNNRNINLIIGNYK